MGVRIRKRDGAWWVFVDYKGRRWAKKVGPGDENKDIAEAVARDARQRLALEAVPFRVPEAKKPSAPLFKDYAVAWLPRHRQLNMVKESTAEDYEKAIRLYLLPAFGDKRLTAIDRKSVKDFIVAVRSQGSVRRPGVGLKPGSVKLMLAPLRLILGEAVDEGILHSNPAAGVGKWNRKRTEREAEGADPFNADELQAIIQTAQKDVPILWPLVGLWAQTGMREGEVFGLQWGDLDLRANTAIVRRTLSKRRLGSPKTGNPRTVSLTHPLLEPTTATVEALRAMELDAITEGRPVTPQSPLFTYSDGKPFRSGVLHYTWQKCLRIAGVRYRCPEQLRHTWASTLLSMGWSLLYVTEQGGWTNATTPLKHYARWIPKQAQPGATQPQLAQSVAALAVKSNT